MSYPNSTSSFTRSIDRFMHRGVAQTAGSAPCSKSMRMSDNFHTVMSRHSVASAVVIEPLSRSSRRCWLSLALQAAANAHTLFSFAPLCGGGLLTVLDLGIAVMGWEVAECNTASSVTAERARSKGSVECSTALQNLRVRKSGELEIFSRLSVESRRRFCKFVLDHTQGATESRYRLM